MHQWLRHPRPLSMCPLQILSENLETKTHSTDYFDAVLVCNGHYTKPHYPDIDGMSTFMGRQLHSHNYRTPDQVKDETLLIVGGGPSGKDILLEAANSATRVLFSSHRDFTKMAFPGNASLKPDVKRFDGNKVEFDDGTVEEITTILFCTGKM